MAGCCALVTSPASSRNYGPCSPSTSCCAWPWSPPSRPGRAPTPTGPASPPPSKPPATSSSPQRASAPTARPTRPASSAARSLPPCWTPAGPATAPAQSNALPPATTKMTTAAPGPPPPSPRSASPCAPRPWAPADPAAAATPPPRPARPSHPPGGSSSPPSSPASPRGHGAATNSPSTCTSSPATCSPSSENGPASASSPAPDSAPTRSTRRPALHPRQLHPTLNYAALLPQVIRRCLDRGRLRPRQARGPLRGRRRADDHPATRGPRGGRLGPHPPVVHPAADRRPGVPVRAASHSAERIAARYRRGAHGPHSKPQSPADPSRLTPATSLRRYPRQRCRHLRGAVEQRLAAQPAGDVAHFADSSAGAGAATGEVWEVPAVVEEAVGEVVRGAVLAQAADSRGKGCRGGRVALVGGEAGAGQVALGPQQGGKTAGRIGVELGEQVAGGCGIPEFMGGARGQRPCPAQGLGAYPEGAGVGERAASVAQRVPQLAAGSGGEGLDNVDHCLVLGIFAGPHAPQGCEHGLRRLDIAAQCRQPGPVAGENLDVRQPIRVKCPGEDIVGGVPVTEQEQRGCQVPDCEGQHVPVAGPARMPGRGAGGLRRGRGFGDSQRIRQVEQHAPQGRVIAGLRGEPRSLLVVGDRLSAPSGPAEVQPAVDKQADELVGVRVEVLAEGEGLSSEPVGVRRTDENFQQRELLQSTHSVEVGVCAQDAHRGGELLAGFGVTSLGAQRSSGDGLGAGCCTRMACLQVALARAACVLDCGGIVVSRERGLRGVFPEPGGGVRGTGGA